MESILDFSQPLDVGVFDSIVLKLSEGTPSEIMHAEKILTQFKQKPDSFFCVDKLLLESKSPNTKFFALQILDEAILHRWNSLDEANQQAVRGFVLSLIVQQCSSMESIRRNRALLMKLNSTLVSIAKREWPVRWPNFIQDIANSASPQDPMIENNLNLFRLIGEEIFEFGEKSLTSRWIERKKAALADNFRFIMDVCSGTLLTAQDSVLLKTALETLTVYVPWMRPALIIQQSILERLTQLIVGDELVRISAVRCFTEICTLKPEEGAEGDIQTQLVIQTLQVAMQYIVTALPTSHSSFMERIVQLYEQGNNVDQSFVSNLNLLLVSFLRNYCVRIAYNDELLISTHELLVGMSNIDEKELFKSCVEYWFWLGSMLLSSSASTRLRSLMTKLQHVLSDVRYVLIKRMAKPEEIILVEEDGELHRQHVTDVEELDMHRLMSQTLIFFTNLDPKDMQGIMVNLMIRQLDRSEWSWHNCNTLSWAVGAIAGVLPEAEEIDLFTTIIKALLTLCKDMQGKENRAVISSDIMFLACRYKNFMKKWPSFMFTVLRKIFEFMSETFPGVQNMAVDTFYKLTEQHANIFVRKEDACVPSFAEEMSTKWTIITSPLSPEQVQRCFAALGFMIAAAEPSEHSKLLSMFLNDTNTNFQAFMETAKANTSFCFDSALLVKLLHCLRIFSNVAGTCGDAFIHEMNVIIQSLHYLYGVFSEAQASAVARNGAAVVATQEYGHLRLAKREILHIFERFVAHSEHLDFIATNIMPDVFSLVLVDYRNSIPVAREAGALALVTACVRTLQQRVAGDCPAILDEAFNTTISMISDNMENYPEFRVNLFTLLGALTDYCFESFVVYTASHSDVLEGMLWAIRHKDYPTMSSGLTTLDHFLENIVHCQLAEAFYTAYIQRIFEEVLHVAMDLFHVAGFPFHCSIMQKLFAVSEMASADAAVVGRYAVTEFLCQTLSVIPTLTKPSILSFVDACYKTYKNDKEFQRVISDFLIEVQIWGSEEENKLQEAEERQLLEETIPGFSTLSTNEPINPFLSCVRRPGE